RGGGADHDGAHGGGARRLASHQLRAGVRDDADGQDGRVGDEDHPRDVDLRADDDRRRRRDDGERDRAGQRDRILAGTEADEDASRRRQQSRSGGGGDRVGSGVVDEVLSLEANGEERRRAGQQYTG